MKNNKIDLIFKCLLATLFIVGVVLIIYKEQILSLSDTYKEQQEELAKLKENHQRVIDSIAKTKKRFEDQDCYFYESTVIGGSRHIHGYYIFRHPILYYCMAGKADYINVELSHVYFREHNSKRLDKYKYVAFNQLAQKYKRAMYVINQDPERYGYNIEAWRGYTLGLRMIAIKHDEFKDLEQGLLDKR